MTKLDDLYIPKGKTTLKFPDDAPYCGMCAYAIGMNKKQLVKFATTRLKSAPEWIIHIAAVCPKCNVITDLTYSSKVNPEPYQEHINLYDRNYDASL